MFYHPAAFTLEIRDVIAAWLVCLTLVAVLFIFAAVENIDESGGPPAMAGIVVPTLEPAEHNSYNVVHSWRSGMEFWVVSVSRTASSLPSPRLAAVAVASALLVQG